MDLQIRNKLDDLLSVIVSGIDDSLSIEEKQDEIYHNLDMMKSFLVSQGIYVESNEVKAHIYNNYLAKVMDKPVVFENREYEPWLDEIRNKIEWKMYDRYERYLLKKKRWSWETVQSIKETSDIVLDHIKNPKSKGFFGSKGLVMGDIQSGKTANYTAVINKAIDAGYRLVIVFAGMTKDLRLQTQNRLDAEVLGSVTKFNNQKGRNLGVGEIDSEGIFVNGLTYSDEMGDLKKVTASLPLHKDMTPLVAVVKKNVTVLRHLLVYISSSQENCYTNDKLDIPVLIIDDEVDQASVNTKDTKELEEASATNRSIRKILNKLNRYAYLGYTATPFANAFVPTYDDRKEDEKDIFPEDFILSIPRPKDYSGVKEYFGLTLDEDDYTNTSLFRDVTHSDYMSFFPSYVQKPSKDTPVEKLNDSIKDALCDFVVASAIKKARGIESHNSMLIHIARVKNPSTTLKDLVKSQLNQMYLEYKYDNSNTKYKDIWKNKFRPISLEYYEPSQLESWKSVEKNLISVLEMSMKGVKVINGDSDDSLDYSANTGQHIIIGGDKLSRGLTLEGLIISYYYRNSTAYDSLLQMGRWFGYRTGWIDLCRVYTNKKFMANFIKAGLAIESFREDIKHMNDLKLTPREFGLRVAYSPCLIPTARNKMRNIKRQKISFSAGVQQLISFEKKFVKANFELTSKFISNLKDPEYSNRKVVFRNQDLNDIIMFLNDYKECSELVGQISVKNWIRYIENLNKKDELVNWTVVLNSNIKGKDDELVEIGGYEIYKPQRTDRTLMFDEDATKIFKVKTIIDPSDFREYFTKDSNEYSECKYYSQKISSKVFPPSDAIMSIYCTDIRAKEENPYYKGKGSKKYKMGKYLSGGKNVISIAIWFPKTNKYEDSTVEYYVNEIYNR